MRTSFLVLASLVVFVACGAPKETDGPKFPAREPGCEIHIFPDNPSYDTTNIGSVQASCEEHIPDAECMRVLKDEACKLGADTVWGVPDPAPVRNGKKRFSGRAAKQK